MPVFLVNLSWQHPALTLMTHTATKSFPPILLRSLSLIHCLFSECNRASAPEVHWLAWLCTKKTTSVLAAMCADSIRAIGVLSNLFQSLSVSLACSLRPETVESFLPSVWRLLRLAGHNKQFLKLGSLSSRLRRLIALKWRRAAVSSVGETEPTWKHLLFSSGAEASCFMCSSREGRTIVFRGQQRWAFLKRQLFWQRATKGLFGGKRSLTYQAWVPAHRENLC